MPVSFKHNLLFIHIPKTGGTSVRYGLGELDPNLLNWKHHTYIRTYKKVLHPDCYEKLFKFTLVRNPWERAVSHYFWLQGDLSRLVNEERWFEANNFPFDHFARNYTPTQLEYIMLDGKLSVDFVGKLEEFDKSLRIVEQKCGIKIPRKHLRTTEHRHYSSYYTPELRDLIGERFKDEIEIFGYEFKSEPRLLLL